MIGQFLIEYIFVFIFNNKYYKNCNLYDVINTLEYKEKLNNYINNNTLLIVGVVAIVFIPVLYYIYRKYKTREKLDLKNAIIFILLGMSISLVYNLLINFIDNSYYSINQTPLYIQIISSGIIGPGLEELLFRGIVYNKLNKFNKVNTAMILSTLIFSIFHFSLVTSIYTLFIGYILVYVYEKYKNLKYSMIIHMSANITSIVFMKLILKQNFIINIIFFTLSMLIMLKIIVFNKKKN